MHGYTSRYCKCGSKALGARGSQKGLAIKESPLANAEGGFGWSDGWQGHSECGAGRDKKDREKAAKKAAHTEKAKKTEITRARELAPEPVTPVRLHPRIRFQLTDTQQGVCAQQPILHVVLCQPGPLPLIEVSAGVSIVTWKHKCSNRQ